MKPPRVKVKAGPFIMVRSSAGRKYATTSNLPKPKSRRNTKYTKNRTAK